MQPPRFEPPASHPGGQQEPEPAHQRDSRWAGGPDHRAVPWLLGGGAIIGVLAVVVAAVTAVAARGVLRPDVYSAMPGVCGTISPQLRSELLVTRAEEPAISDTPAYREHRCTWTSAITASSYRRLMVAALLGRRSDHSSPVGYATEDYRRTRQQLAGEGYRVTVLSGLGDAAYVAVPIGETVFDDTRLGFRVRNLTITISYGGKDFRVSGTTPIPPAESRAVVLAVARKIVARL